MQASLDRIAGVLADRELTTLACEPLADARSHAANQLRLRRSPRSVHRPAGASHGARHPRDARHGDPGQRWRARDLGRLPRTVWQRHRHRSRPGPADALRSLFETVRARGRARDAADRRRGLHRPLHRAAPAFRGDPQRRACRARPGAERSSPGTPTDARTTITPTLKLATARLEFSSTVVSRRCCSSWPSPRSCFWPSPSGASSWRTISRRRQRSRHDAAEHGAASGPGKDPHRTRPRALNA